MVVLEAPDKTASPLHRLVASAAGFRLSLAPVALGADAGVACPAVRAADDAGAALPGQRWAVASVSRMGKPVKVASHPDWCALDRCGHLVPPLMPHMARRHRGPMNRVGEIRGSGLIATYIIGTDDQAPSIVVHATARVGNAWAELALPQAAQLLEQLRELLEQAHGDQGAGDE